MGSKGRNLLIRNSRLLYNSVHDSGFELHENLTKGSFLMLGQRQTDRQTDRRTSGVICSYDALSYLAKNI